MILVNHSFPKRSDNLIGAHCFAKYFFKGGAVRVFMLTAISFYHKPGGGLSTFFKASCRVKLSGSDDMKAPSIGVYFSFLKT